MVKRNFKKLISFIFLPMKSHTSSVSVHLAVSVLSAHCVPRMVNYLVARTVWAYLLRTEHQKA